MKRILPKRLPIPTSMNSAEREYQRNLYIYQKKYVSLVTAGINEILGSLRDEGREFTELLRSDSADRMDGPNIEKSIRIMFEQVQAKLMKLFPDSLLAIWAKRMVAHVNDISKKNIITTGAAVDIDIEPLLKDKKLTPFFQNVVDENVGLIRSIPESRMAPFKNALVNAITADQSQRDIAEIISKYTQGTNAKPKMIARDQVNKLNGRLTQYRQEKLGGKRYIWRTSRDERVAGNPTGKYPDAKPSHWDREGEIFYWDDAPPGGHPGQRIQCRCTAEMILSDVVD